MEDDAAFDWELSEPGALNPRPVYRMNDRVEVYFQREWIPATVYSDCWGDRVHVYVPGPARGGYHLELARVRKARS